MAAIDVYLQQILDAVYGEEVRGSIHDSIYYMNIESTTAEAAAISAQTSATNSATVATTAKNDAVTAKNDAVTAKLAAEAAAREARQVVTGAVRYKGTVTFANLPATGMLAGDEYNISDSFTADSRFRPEDVGKHCDPGTNVVYDDNSKWDIYGQANTGNNVPDGGILGQLLKKNSSTNGDTTWGPGLYYFNTVSQMNTAISNGTVPNGSVCFVTEGSGSTPVIALSDITNVELANLLDGQVLTYDNTNGVWKNVTLMTIKKSGNDYGFYDENSTFHKLTYT